eukprot:gene2790-1775_t
MITMMICWAVCVTRYEWLEATLIFRKLIVNALYVLCFPVDVAEFMLYFDLGRLPVCVFVRLVDWRISVVSGDFMDFVKFVGECL